MMTRRANFIILTIATALSVTGISLMLTSRQRVVPAAVDGAAAAEASAVRVPGLTVERRAVRERVELPGIVKPVRRVVLAAEIDGKVATLGGREHEAVAADQLILQLDDTLRRVALDRAEAAVLRTESAHRLAQLELERLRRLLDKGVTSQAEVDRAASEERSTYGAAAEARALRAEAAELLAKTVVRAPFAGVLNDFDLEVADQVKAGMRIGELIDISRVEVDVGATEAELRVLRPGDAVQVQTDMHPERAVGGTIERIASAAHLVSRKFPVKVVAGNTAGLLLPGMVVRVVADAGDEEPRLWVPKQATVEEFGVSYVFVLRPVDDRLVAERRTITARPVAFRPAEVEVTSGLEHGERIAAGNLRELRDGTPVVIEEPL